MRCTHIAHMCLLVLKSPQIYSKKNLLSLCVSDGSTDLEFLLLPITNLLFSASTLLSLCVYECVCITVCFIDKKECVSAGVL